jgi:hypothetical protein
MYVHEGNSASWGPPVYVPLPPAGTPIYSPGPGDHDPDKDVDWPELPSWPSEEKK